MTRDSVAKSRDEPSIVFPKTVARDVFFAGYKTHFSGGHGYSDTSRRGLDQLLDFIFNDPAIVDLRWAAYILATVRAECGHAYMPVETSIRSAAEHSYFGRGYVPLRTKKNYEDIGRLIGKDLVGNPDLVLEPAIAYRIMTVCLTTGKGFANGRKLRDFISDGKCDYVSARCLVGGPERSHEVARYAHAFETVLRASVRDQPSRAIAASTATAAAKAAPARGRQVSANPEIDSLHWIAISLTAKPDLGTRPSWWAARNEPRYGDENFEAKLTNGAPRGKLNFGGTIRFESLPAGSCSIRFASIYEDVENLFKNINSQTFE